MRDMRLGCLALALLCCLACATRAAEVTVFAAASLTSALQEIGEKYRAKTGERVTFSFAASSILAKQVEAGAAAALFLSADEAWMDYLDRRKLLAPGSRVSLLGNRLVLVVPAGAGAAIDFPAGGWLERLPEGRIATGDPAHVPVGRYAQQALTRLGVWAKVEGRLARTENVRIALALVERGEAIAGIVYASDAAASKSAAIAGIFPEETHEPISYPLAILAAGDTTAARAFYGYLRTPEAGAVFTKNGFTGR